MFTRRDVMAALGGLAGAGATGWPGSSAEARSSAEVAADLTTRRFGRTERWLVPLGLGGQASLQWTASGIDPADIVVRAIELGVNYLDSANAYGPSQVNYGAAFRRLHLIPGEPDYNAALRERLFIATKTGQRLAHTRGSTAPAAIEDLKRSLTQMFGDGKGWIPEGAYLDSIQMHNLTSFQEVDLLYEGLDRRDDPNLPRLGALAGLLDYRDGTNVTGLNPERRRYIRHIGVTGHQSSPVLMNALQRDDQGIVDTLLVALNANDRRFSSHQYNVLPVAAARDLGVIAMKSFADGVFYGKAPRWSTSPGDVVRSVGQAGAVEYADLVRYPISLPGVTLVITGIGQIDRDDPSRDQLASNLAASQQDMPSDLERLRIEDDVVQRHGSDTNYFQERLRAPVQPADVGVTREADQVTIWWRGALAAFEPIRSYRIYAGDQLLATVPCQPQTTLVPLSATLPADALSAAGDAPLRVVASIAPPEA